MIRILAFLAALVALAPTQAHAQASVILYCYNGATPDVTVPCSSTNPVPITGTITLTFPTIGAAVPATGLYNAINVAGTLRGLTGLSTGSIFPATVAIVDASGNQITTFGSTNTQGPVAPGAAAANSDLTGCQFNTSLPAPTTTQQVATQCDASGRQIVAPAISGDIIINPSANFTRLANTTAYASGQLIANSATAGSVVPLSWTASRIATGNFRITRVRMSLSGKSVTNTNFRIHFFNASPGFANGDGGTFTPSVLADEVCEMDVTIGLAGSDVSMGYGASNQGVACDVALASGSTLYGAVEARAAYTPVSGETVTVIPEVHQN